jgi:hypothetical protein
MKKVLLSFILLSAFVYGKAQKDVVINEIYPDPSASNEEYIELYNTTSFPINLDCYTLVSYYNTGSGGAYVLQLPNITLPAFGHVVFSQATPISHQGGTYNGGNQYSWNSFNTTYSATASLKQYTRSGNVLGTETNVTTTDLIPITGGNSTALALMLFDGSGQLVNAFFANNSGNVPTNITSLTGLNIPIQADAGSLCNADATLDFGGISAPEAETFQLNAAPGTDNGYRRERDGFCGTWEKNEPANTYSPGEKNSNLPPVDASTSVVMGAVIDDCGAGATSSWDISIQITDAGLVPGTYRIYIDVDNSLGLNAGDQLLTSGAIPSTSAVVLNDYQVQKGYPVILQVVTASGCIVVTRAFDTQCSPLPVKFKTFNAIRSNGSSVAITWTTAMEQNSKGFNIQRNVNGEWKTIAYVPSQSLDGNSSSDLNYSFVDGNSEKGITQYRIQQVDLDGNSKFSDIRAIRGDGNLAKVVVYPNPSTDGKVNIVFEDNSSLRDIIVNDMQGKVIRSFRGISNNILVIEKLTTGFYTIKVSNRTTNASSVHKVVIK